MADDALDAARYRELRSYHTDDSGLAVVLQPKKNVMLGAVCPSEELLDGLLDARLAKKAAEQSAIPTPVSPTDTRNELQRFAELVRNEAHGITGEGMKLPEPADVFSNRSCTVRVAAAMSPCACLGPTNGEPYCNCYMVQRNLPRSEEHRRKQAEAYSKIKAVFDSISKDSEQVNGDKS